MTGTPRTRASSPRPASAAAPSPLGPCRGVLSPARPSCPGAAAEVDDETGSNGEPAVDLDSDSTRSRPMTAEYPAGQPVTGRRAAGPRPVRAPRGTTLTCKGWPQEAAMRMLMNNLDPEVAEHPDELIVYGGSGRAARSWDAFDGIVRSLRDLEADETLLVQSGKPVGVFRTHEWAPRVLIANSNLVPQWATWEEFRRLESLGLTMFGQMTAGSWIYIGTQGILQGTYETFAAVAAKRFGGALAGTITLTAGLGGMGGAQPLAVTMNGGVAICIECDPSRISRRIEYGYLDVAADNIDDAVRQAVAARDAAQPLSIGLLG